MLGEENKNKKRLIHPGGICRISEVDGGLVKEQSTGSGILQEWWMNYRGKWVLGDLFSGPLGNMQIWHAIDIGQWLSCPSVDSDKMINYILYFKLWRSCGTGRWRSVWVICLDMFWEINDKIYGDFIKLVQIVFREIDHWSPFNGQLLNGSFNNILPIVVTFFSVMKIPLTAKIAPGIV